MKTKADGSERNLFKAPLNPSSENVNDVSQLQMHQNFRVE